jgi:bacteriorhodopsin
LLILLDLSEKINISCSNSFAYYSLNTIAAVFLSILLIRLVLQSVEKCRVRRHKRGTSRRRALNIRIFVFLLAILVFRLLAVGLGLIRRTNRCLSYIVCSLIAKRILALSRAASADGSPASLKRAGNGVVFQTGRPNRIIFANYQAMRTCK